MKKSILPVVALLLMATSVFAKTNEAEIAPSACCTSRAYDSEGDELIRVSVCSGGSSAEDKITACIKADAELERVIEMLMP